MLFNPARIPTLVLRPWRLVPELDAYPDEQCVAFLEGARLHRKLALGLAFVLAMVVAAGLLIGGGALERRLPRRSPWVSQHAWQGRLATVAWVPLWGATVVSVALTPYPYFLRSGVREQLRRASCPGCRYSLQGLVAEDGRVRCPECGLRVTLSTLGLREASLSLGRPLPSPRPAPTPSRPGGRVRLATGLVLVAAGIALYVAFGASDLASGLIAFGFGVLVMPTVWEAMHAAHAPAEPGADPGPVRDPKQ